MDAKVRHVRVPATKTLQNQTDRETCFYFEQEESKEVNVEGRGRLNTRPLKGKEEEEVRAACTRWPLCAESAVMCRSPRSAITTA